MTFCTTCLGCSHRRPLSAAIPADTACHYLLDTGKQRGCTPAHCTHWQPSPEALRLLALAKKGD